ncbi:MAG TPA: glycosyltransferase family 2 protein [Solirubrobacteraceae bacterium]|nr:glycosyltransferase family 2 protein [Solirubrobacteraceae bacterium]
MPPRITVITPAYNAVATIEQTLASVRAQDYPDLEHLVIDGGSTDGTVDLLRETDGITWISEPDRGLAHAMNKGIAMATGEIVGEINADDVYLPGALAAVGAAAEAHPEAEWLTGRCPIIDGDGTEIRKPVTAYKNFLLRHYSLPVYLTQNFISAPATFFRTAPLREIGGFDERYRISVDYDLQLKFARRGDPVILHRDLSAFRMVEGTLSMSGFETQFREHAEQAVRHGAGHPIPVAVNRVTSRAIVLAYRAMRAARR